ncbi:hypothetical protein IQ07DRAFT_640671 [Pyrenochaeta sp. DS3sAY3a]|nr:hypothetical protein IQ07DRAFT_640671 [Pyrenochaeta sp. DS3sAY3a]
MSQINVFDLDRPTKDLNATMVGGRLLSRHLTRTGVLPAQCAVSATLESTTVSRRARKRGHVFNGCIVLRVSRRRVRPHWWVEAASAELKQSASAGDEVQMKTANELTEVEYKNSTELLVVTEGFKEEQCRVLVRWQEEGLRARKHEADME